MEDAAHGIVEGLLRYEGEDPVNLGTGEEITIRDLALKIQALTGFEGSPDSTPPTRMVSPAGSDTSRALERFGWQAPTRLDEGLQRTVAWVQGALASAGPS